MMEDVMDLVMHKVVECEEWDEECECIKKNPLDIRGFFFIILIEK
jgi:hypothetical protein